MVILKKLDGFNRGAAGKAAIALQLYIEWSRYGKSIEVKLAQRIPPITIHLTALLISG